jgi:FAD synthetase
LISLNPKTINFFFSPMTLTNFWMNRLHEISSKSHIIKSLEIIKKAFYLSPSPDSLVIAFNGGKDCTVLLYLVLYVAMTTGTSSKDVKFPSLVYLSIPDCFPEEDEFTKKTAADFNLIEIPDKSLKEGLKVLKSEHPQVKYIFMGTRSTDPHGRQLDAFAPTSEGWPAFIRVNPILDWNYLQIWEFLDFLQVPVCPLYEQGYTSVGSVSTTSKNPKLRKNDGTYLHARELRDEFQERAGRKN